MTSRQPSRKGQIDTVGHDRRTLGRAELVDQLRALGVERGGVLLVHTSFRAVRPIADGPRGLIDALRAALGRDGTLVMPSWTGQDDAPFEADRTPAAADLGAVADLFWRLPFVRRSDHPHAFAALGPLAERIVGDPLPPAAHGPTSPVGRVHELDGRVLLLGVGADSTIHLAELLAGVPYRVARHVTVMRAGVAARVTTWETDHCCARFDLLDPALRGRGRQREGRVGHAHARLAGARDIVATACALLARDPLVFLHAADAGCAECDRARASVVVPSGTSLDQR